ncbi:glycosyltransferase family 39 protein [Neorhizobium galegae]|uniref:ArnT family glycosyltransferase n=1 Tax=Neorhizobium galegae TaxID=399 RepID=UPI000620F4F2|nr:glycosyltransferase family 39 protein [Neorhizobium galegae]CDZ26446.1 PMT family glycosyltransferase, 4-amino-4-deoxy-L-arabinose transferase [Neorhizobium galegae bv. officinalis]MCM2497240.1 glycosyltransferase family 39 protein [Neorhizobium galegae]MCQ1775132.1 glycosyltransferase family 39 protein [Neorhizobium galegae]MCQ1777053.1 glycosyltransferase family 39 protein [Neorhizobium galegae]MCQ1795757.1 glycosyltransferase family 39 protein [Neorhizobium galegae]
MNRESVGAVRSEELNKPGRLAAFLAGGLRPAALFLGAYFLLSIAVRLMLPNALTLDEAEQALFSQYWLAGYGPQPPFYNWVQNAFVSVIGISLFSLTLPKFLMLLLCYVFFGMAAREIDARPAFAAMAMLSLLTLPQLSYMPQQDLTHTVAVLMATSLFLYGLFRTLVRADWQGYVIVGVATGIGMISKYNFGLLPASALIAVCCDREWRARLFDLRILLTAVISLAIVLPHALWLLGNLDLATSGTIGKMVEANAPHGIARIARALASLMLACIAFGALTVIIFAVAFKKDFRRSLTAGDRWTRLLGLMMAVGLLGVVGVILFTGTTKITERWLDPYLLPLPLYLLLKLERAGIDATLHLKRLVPVFIVIMAVTSVPLAGKTFTAGLTGAYTRINYPLASVAEALKAEGRPAVIVAAGMHLAGNMRLQFPDVPVINSEQPIAGFPAPDDMKGPVLAIWSEGGGGTGSPPIDLSSVDTLGLTASPAKSLSRPYYYGDGKMQLNLGYLWLR